MSTEREFNRLEAALLSAGREIVYPPTPGLAARARAQLEGAAAPHGRLWRARHAWSIAFAILFALALLLAVPGTREAIAQLLGLRSIQIIAVTPTPTPSPAPTPRASETAPPTITPSPTPRAQCCPSTLAEAQARSRFKLLLPPDQTPSRVYLQELFGDGQQVILVFGDPGAPDFTLYEAHSFLYQKVVTFGKGIGPGTVITETKVHDLRALWLTGDAHLLVYLDPSGNPIPESQRVVDANTLAWESAAQDITYRIETQLDLAAARRFAESLQ